MRTYVGPMDLELTGTRVLVTGASKGIGRAIAESFLDEGAVVSICARDADVLAGTAERLADRGAVHHRAADIATEGEPAALVGWAADAMGGLDVLVSNVSAMAGPDWVASANVDLVRTNELIRAALSHMDDHANANIVCIGSRAANVAARFSPSEG